MSYIKESNDLVNEILDECAGNGECALAGIDPSDILTFTEDQPALTNRHNFNSCNMKAFLVCFENQYNDIVYLLLEKLPTVWNGGIPTYCLGWNGDSVIVGDTEDEANFNWRIAGSDRTPLEYFEYQHVEPGDCYLIEMDEEDKWIRFKSYIGMYYTDDLYQEKTSETVYIVCTLNPIYNSKRFILLKSLPTRWEGDSAVFSEDQFISYINWGQEYEIVEQGDSYPYNPHTWCTNKMVVGGTAVFKKRGKKLELVSNFTANLHITCLPVAEFLDGSTDHSDCVCTDDVDPFDIGVHEEKPADDPALIHAYLICHSVNGEKHFTLMWNLPIGWTTFDSIYYNNVDVIEEVVPGCKYSFVKLNMSAYAYGDVYMMPGDVTSCEIVGKRIDHFTQLIRYSVQGGESVEQFIKDARPIVSTPICKNVNGEHYYTLKRVEGDPNKAVDEEVAPDFYHSEGSVVDDNSLNDRHIHPDYYNWMPDIKGVHIECQDIAQNFNYNLGQVCKYMWRAGHKTEAGVSNKAKKLEDLKKIEQYIKFEIERVNKYE